MKNYYSHPIYPIPDPAAALLGSSVESEKNQGGNSMKQGTYNIPYDRYQATINGRTFKTEFSYLDIKRISETFKNVEWRLVR